MGYIFLAVSLFAGAAKGFCGKKTSGFTSDYRDAVGVNVIRMLLCIVIGFVFVLFDGGVACLAPQGNMLPFAAAAGVSTAIFAVTWLLSVRVGAYMLVDVSLMCSVLVPIIGSFIVFDEKIGVRDIIGLVLLVAAVVCMCIYNNKTKAKLTVVASILLVVCGLSSGMSDFSQKLYVADGGTAVAAFGFYTYIFAAVALLVFFLATAAGRRRTPRTEGNSFVRVLPFVFVMALCMFAASYFQTMAASHLSATVLYPMARGGALILSAVMSRLFFGEKLTVGSLLGMGLAFAALLVINL